jgi:hypothetical protein
MKYLRWIHIEDYARKDEAYIEDESADIIEDESIAPKKINPVITNRWIHWPENASGSIV